MHTKMLIPLDGSKTAEQILPYARYLAGRFKIPVELLAIIEMADFVAHTPPGQTPLYEKIIVTEAERSAAYLRGIAGTFAGTDVNCTVEKGRPAEVIATRSGSDPGVLTAMTTHGRSGLGRFVIGSVAEKVLRTTASSLLIVRATEVAKTEGEASFKNVIVPLDGSELGAAITPKAADLAKTLGLEVILFRVYRIPYEAYGDENYVAITNYDEIIAAAGDEAKKYIEEKAAEFKKLGTEKVSHVTREGRPADEIIALAREVPGTLIAMASHGRSGVQRWMLGSVTEAVVRHAETPVLVMRPA
jgi:nucleotide-binding universal stress UspA family protein